MSALDRLPTPDDRPRFSPQPKGKSRLELQVEQRPLIRVTERDFLKEVRDRDRLHCRMCFRLVKIIAARKPERAEVHHIHGRHGDLRFDSRCALLLCLQCHEKVTGRVNEKWKIVGTVFLEIRNQFYIDARQPVTFERVA